MTGTRSEPGRICWAVLLSVVLFSVCGLGCSGWAEHALERTTAPCQSEQRNDSASVIEQPTRLVGIWLHYRAESQRVWGIVLCCDNTATLPPDALTVQSAPIVFPFRSVREADALLDQRGLDRKGVTWFGVDMHKGWELMQAELPLVDELRESDPGFRAEPIGEADVGFGSSYVVFAMPGPLTARGVFLVHRSLLHNARDNFFPPDECTSILLGWGEAQEKIDPDRIVAFSNGAEELDRYDWRKFVETLKPAAAHDDPRPAAGTR